MEDATSTVVGSTVTAGKGVVAEIHTGGASLDSTVASLAQKPETAWMAEIAKRDDVIWNRVQEAHEHWDYKSQGLSPSGAAILSIAVMVATQGAGAAFAGSLGFAEGTAGFAMAPAGFSSLVAQASVSLVNNQGNLGKVLQELGSLQTAKNLAITVAAAGAFYEVGTLTDGHFTEAGKTVGGKTAGQYFASADYFKNMAGHALVGGTASALGGGSFAGGALSGGFGSVVSPVAIMLNQQVPYTGLATTVAVGGTASALGGGTFAQGAMTAGLGYLFNDIALMTSRHIDGSPNVFGHSAAAVEGNGTYSYGNDTKPGSSTTDYLNRQVRLRDVEITIIPTSANQDASALTYVDQFRDINGVGLIENCTWRSSGILDAAGLNSRAWLGPVPLPADLASYVRNMVRGATTIHIPKGGQIPDMSRFDPK